MSTPHPQHIVVIPYPAQGHILPLMDLSLRLSHLGFLVTFVNTTHNHDRIARSMAATGATLGRVRLVSIPDGMETQEERDTPGKLSEAVLRVLPRKFEELIEETIGEIESVVADQSLGWALDIATRKGIRTAAFCPASAAQLVVALCIPKLIADGIINKDGIPIGKQRFELAEGMPELSTEDLVWTRLGNEAMKKHVFQLMLNNTNSTSSAQLILCNSALDLEQGAFLASPRKLLPIGPLCASPSSPSVDSSSSLEWLDRHEPGTVTYVAFGSLALLTKEQLEEIALGLEMTDRPFLWATTCQDSSFPEGWEERTAGQGKVVGWTDQREVLGHPSVGCFLSHCGWNSTIEGVSNGVPLLCCPQFADQFLNKGYICDVWRVGVELRKDDGGAVVTRHEIKEKVDKVYGDEGHRRRALELKGMVRASVVEGGMSHENFEYLVDWIKRV